MGARVTSLLGLVDRLSSRREAEFVNRTQDEILVTGGPVSIRRACLADREAVRDFFAGLSPWTRYLRFFGALRMSSAMLRVLSGGGDADAVVASRHGEIIGHGMATDLVSTGGGTATEIGVVVADAWQGQGIGSALVRTLLGAARARDSTIVAMDVLHANHQVLAMIASHWPAATVERSADSVSFHVRLAPRQPGRSRLSTASKHRSDHRSKHRLLAQAVPGGNDVRLSQARRHELVPASGDRRCHRQRLLS